MNKPEAARYFKMAIDAGNKDAMRNFMEKCYYVEMGYQ